jgi:hypothetical protein
MTYPTPSPNGDPASTAERMAAIADGLHAAGLDAQVHDTHGVLDVTAMLHRPGSKAIDLTVDEDNYIQLAWWNPDDASPGQIVATIRRVLAAITEPS